jgi:hypothetical protein
MDYSRARNDFGGFDNAPSFPNTVAFATLQTDGSITAWGYPMSGGSNAPAGTGYLSLQNLSYPTL